MPTTAFYVRYESSQTVRVRSDPAIDPDVSLTSLRTFELLNTQVEPALLRCE